MQAGTRVNVEQASKRAMREPTSVKAAAERVSAVPKAVPVQSERRSIAALASGSSQNHQCPVFPMEDQGWAGGSASPFCSSSTEMLSGERMKAMRPSRGGRLMVTPASMSR